jgi:putative selenium metabolism protein SsnA
MIIENARILTFDSSNRVLNSGAVEIRDGCVARVFDQRARVEDPSHKNQDRFDARGRLLMPALINCHTHLYSTLARGISLPGTPPKNFPEILKKLWWRLDRALNEDDVYYSALVGVMDSARCGVGTLVDHHSSPSFVNGSLDVIERAFREVGLRGVLCYETTDRNGLKNAQAGMDENVRFIEHARKSDGLVNASFGLHASFTLSDRTLQRCVEANESLKTGFHVHVSEDRSDNEDARRKHGKSPVRRLHELGVLNERALAAHCIHVSGGDITALARHKINVVHNPQSNCNNAVGAARVLEMVKAGVLVGLGSDGYSPRMWDEFKTAFHVQKLRASDPRVAYGEAYALALLNNRTIARRIWGLELGRIEKGARADLVLYDYFPPTPLNADNIFGHALFGIANAPVDSLIVSGKFVIRNREFVNVNERAVAEKASACARQLWRRF